MKILFLCTAHNSLSQRLFLALKTRHEITIEFAVSNESMLSAASLAEPDLIICPFLTSLVPKDIYQTYLTLIIHPGPPGDGGPSAIDWLLLGDDGSIDDSDELLRQLDNGNSCSPGRTSWGVTVLQAIEEFDAGPVWAFDQFQIDIDQPGQTKSSLYRGPITEAALNATQAAISRIEAAGPCSPQLHAELAYRTLSVSDHTEFQGSRLHKRPLLRAAQREIDPARHSSLQISRRIRCSDSQPGALSKVFGPSLYLYGGIVDDLIGGEFKFALGRCTLLGTRNGTVCIATSDMKGIWITHVRQPKGKSDVALWPKVPAVDGLLNLGLLSVEESRQLEIPLPIGCVHSSARTFQDIWIDWQNDTGSKWTAYLHFDFYNGGMDARQCSRLINAMDHILEQSANGCTVQAVVLMGGAYFSNGIALNVIEAAADPPLESWLSINRMNDVVYYLLHHFPSRKILTIAAIRGNAAAGGVALATACDVVIAGAGVVLNPAYRALGIHGSEYHTLSYYGRCGQANAIKVLRAMMPMSPLEAQSIGLVDFVFPGTGKVLDDHIRFHISYLLKPKILMFGFWKKRVDLSPLSIARAQANELREMSLDFWGPRSTRYHRRRFEFVRKVKPTQTPLRFAEHRRGLSEPDEEETDEFDRMEFYQQMGKERSMSQARTPLLQVSTNMNDAHQSAKSLSPAEKSNDTLFCCYYEASVEEISTVPDSPMQSKGSVAAQISVVEL